MRAQDHRAREHPVAQLPRSLRGQCAGVQGAQSACAIRSSRRSAALVSGYIAWRFGFTLATAGALVFAWTLIALAFIDLDTQLLPDDITLPLLWAGPALQPGRRLRAALRRR